MAQRQLIAKAHPPLPAGNWEHTPEPLGNLTVQTLKTVLYNQLNRPKHHRQHGFYFFQAASLVLESSLQCWLITLRRDLLNSVSFSNNFLKLFLSCLPSCLRCFPAGQNILIFEEAVKRVYSNISLGFVQQNNSISFPLWL